MKKNSTILKTAMVFAVAVFIISSILIPGFTSGNSLVAEAVSCSSSEMILFSGYTSGGSVTSPTTSDYLRNTAYQAGVLSDASLYPQASDAPAYFYTGALPTGQSTPSSTSYCYFDDSGVAVKSDTDLTTNFISGSNYFYTYNGSAAAPSGVKFGDYYAVNGTNKVLYTKKNTTGDASGLTISCTFAYSDALVSALSDATKTVSAVPYFISKEDTTSAWAQDALEDQVELTLYNYDGSEITSIVSNRTVSLQEKMVMPESGSPIVLTSGTYNKTDCFMQVDFRITTTSKSNLPSTGICEIGVCLTVLQRSSLVTKITADDETVPDTSMSYYAGATYENYFTAEKNLMYPKNSSDGTTVYSYTAGLLENGTYQSKPTVSYLASNDGQLGTINVADSHDNYSNFYWNIGNKVEPPAGQEQQQGSSGGSYSDMIVTLDQGATTNLYAGDFDPSSLMNNFNGNTFFFGTTADGSLEYADNDSGLKLSFVFAMSDMLVEALADRMVTVSVVPYIITLSADEINAIDVVGQSGNSYVRDLNPDTCNVKISCYNGNSLNTTAKLQKKSYTLSLGCENVSMNYPKEKLELTSGTYSSRNGFLQVDLSNFSKKGAVSTVICEVGIRIGITPNSNVKISDSSEFSIAGTPEKNSLGEIVYEEVAHKNVEEYLSEENYTSYYNLFYTHSYEQASKDDGYVMGRAYYTYNAGVYSKVQTMPTADQENWTTEGIEAYKKYYVDKYTKISKIGAYNPLTTYYWAVQYRNLKENASMTNEVNYASIGSVIKFDIRLQEGGMMLYLTEDGKPDGTSLSGSIFKKLFCPNDSFIIEYLVENGEMTVDATSSQTGQDALITVESSGIGSDYLVFRAATRYTNKVTGARVTLSYTTFSIFVDEEKPNAPSPDKNTFFETYLSESGAQKYYTGAGDNSVDTDQSGNQRINLSKSDKADEKISFTLESLGVQKYGKGYQRLVGGSNQTVYYKTSYFGTSLPSSPGDRIGEEFTVKFNEIEMFKNGLIYYEPATTLSKSYGSYVGEYCTVTNLGGANDEAEVQYYPLYVSTMMRDGSNNLGTITQGVWMIEFCCYDSVGNKIISGEKYFIQIDINPYTFDVKYYVGTATNTAEKLSSTDVMIAYETLTATGDISNKGAFKQQMEERSDNNIVGQIQLYRGDYVILRPTIKSSAYSLYALTGFKVGSSSTKDCSDFIYNSDNQTLLYFDSTEFYLSQSAETVTSSFTFEVSDVLCRSTGASNRVLQFYFKKRVTLEAFRQEQDYSGSSSAIRVTAKYKNENGDEETMASGKIDTVYYEPVYESAGDYSYGDSIYDSTYEDVTAQALLDRSNWGKNRSKYYTKVNTYSQADKKYSSKTTYYYQGQCYILANSQAEYDFNNYAWVTNSKNYYFFESNSNVESADENFLPSQDYYYIEWVRDPNGTGLVPGKMMLATELSAGSANDNEWANTYHFYSYFTGDGLFSASGQDYNGDINYYMLEKDYYSVVTEIVADDYKYGLYEGRYDLYYVYNGYEYLEAPSTFNENEVYYSFTGNYYVLKNYNQSTMPISALMNNYTFEVATDEVFLQGKLYFRLVDGVGSAPVHQGNYLCFASVSKANLYYFGQCVFPMRIKPATTVLNTLEVIKGNADDNCITLNYGDSLSKIDGRGIYDEQNKQQYGSYFKVEINGMYYNNRASNSTSNVYGYYMLTLVGEDETPSDANYDQYLKPEAGMHEYQVRFTPILTDQYGTPIYAEKKIDGVTYYCFQRNYDYSLSYATVMVYVAPSSAVQFVLDGTVEDDTVVYTYTGSVITLPKSETLGDSGKQGYRVLSLIEASDGTVYRQGKTQLDLTSPYTVVYYASIDTKNEAVDESRLSTVPPVNAGLYRVRVVLVGKTKTSKSGCNYNAYVDWTMEVKKIELTLSVPEKTEFEFQYDNYPTVTMRQGQKPFTGSVGMTYTFYHKVSSLGYNDNCVEEYKVSSADLRQNQERSTPSRAGSYVVKVTVNDNNYSGITYGDYVVKTVTTDNTYMTVSWPEVYKSTLSQNYNLAYGQPLAEARLSTGQTSYVKYSYLTYARTGTSSSIVTIGGEFLIVEREYDSWLTQEQKTDSATSKTEYITAMKTYVPEKALYGGSGSYNYYLCFAPSTDYQNDFDFLYLPNVSFSVGQAYLDWSRVSIASIEYETSVASISDLEVTGKVGLLYSQKDETALPTGEEGTDYYIVREKTYRYVYLYIQDYYLSYESKEANVFAVGRQWLSIKFNKNNDTLNNFALDQTKSLYLDILPKELTVVYHDGVYSPYYNNYDEQEFLQKTITFTGAERTLPQLTGLFIYTKAGVSYQYSTKQKGYVQGTFDGDTFTETAGETKQALSAGTYSVYFEIKDANYAGSLSGFSLVIQKAPLYVKKRPELSNESLVAYHKPYSDLNGYFTGGVICSQGKSAEVVEGVYTVNETGGANTFGNAGTKVGIYLDFTPKDSENYEVLYGNEIKTADDKQLTLYFEYTVQKADISGNMTLSVANYVYRIGHTTDEVTYEALGRKYLYDGDMTEAKKQEYYEYIKSHLDYTCSLPSEISAYHMIIEGTTTGEYLVVRSSGYQVTLIVDNDNYKGEVTSQLNVLRDKAYIQVSGTLDGATNTNYITEKEYNGLPQTVYASVYNSKNEKINEVGVLRQFVTLDGQTISSPTTIGEYDVRLSLASTQNYYLVNARYSEGNWILPEENVNQITSKLVVGIDEQYVQVSNLTQEYGNFKKVSCDTGKNNAVCSVEFIKWDSKNNEETGSRYTDVPSEAGTYNVHLVFDYYENNGYEKDIIWRERLVIQQKEAKIICIQQLRNYYSGKNIALFSAYSDPNGLKLVSYYKVDDEYQTISMEAIGALSVGDYDIRLQIEDPNYCGTYDFVLSILPAVCYIRTEPVFDTYEYNSSVMPSAVTQAEVYCPSVEVTDALSGSYIIDPTSVNTLAVGKHRVEYTFRPTDTNFASVKGTAMLTIVKAQYDPNLITLALKDNLDLLTNSDYVVQYDGYSHYLEVRFDEGQIYDYEGENKDFSVLLGYGTEPRAIGYYTVSARVVSNNYECEKVWPYQLRIDKGIPTIQKTPSVKEEVVYSLAVGGTKTIIKGHLQNNGKAVIATTGETLEGSFDIKDGSQTFTRANKNTVTLVFTPNDNNFVAVEVDIYVNVVGKDILDAIDGSGQNIKLPAGQTINHNDWSSASSEEGKSTSRLFRPSFAKDGDGLKLLSTDDHTHGSQIVIRPKNKVGYLTYGAKVSDFVLSYEPCKEGCALCQEYADLLNENGILRFASPSDIPNVGDSVEVVYTMNPDSLEGQEVLNEMTGFMQLGTILRKVSYSANDIELVVFDGKSWQTDYRLTFYQTVAGKRAVIDLQPNENGVEFDAVGAFSLQDNIGDKEVFLTKFESKNYEVKNLTPSSPIQVSYHVYTLQSPETMMLTHETKEYNQKVIMYEDILPLVSGPSVVFDKSDYSVEVLDGEGIAIGSYKVKVILKDERHSYYCEKVFDVEVTKRDVSDEVSLSKVSDIYASDTCGTNPEILIGSERLDTSCVKISYRPKGTKNAYVSSVLQAGEYEIKVVIQSDLYYGEARLTYTILPKTIEMSSESVYSYVYGNEKNENGRKINLSFSDSYDGGYTLYFEGVDISYERTTSVPTNAGNYLVYVVLNDTNCTLSYNTFRYIISEKAVVMEQEPGIRMLQDARGEKYNLKYGDKLSVINNLFIGGKVVSDGVTVEGKFAVEESIQDTVYNAGTYTVTIVFTPTNSNYASVVFSKSVIVGKIQATVLFNKLEASYNGKGIELLKEWYTVTPSININISFVGLDGTVYAKPVNWGTYYLRLETAEQNYSVISTVTSQAYTGLGTSESSDFKEGMPAFYIRQAEVNTSKVVIPTVTPVYVGESIGKSSFNGIGMYYQGFDYAQEGTYSFIQSNLAFSDAGNYVVQYKFTPNNVNLATYIGQVTIEIKKGIAQVSVQNNTQVYGEILKIDKNMFVTKPSGLEGDVYFTLTYNGKTYTNGVSKLNAGTYFFTCWVESKNYSSEKTEFRYVVEKKAIDMDICNENGEVITSINVKYAKQANFSYLLYDESSKETKRYYYNADANGMYDNIQVLYESRSTEEFSYSDKERPTRIGSYTLTATLVHDNYTAEVTATYKINKGTVEYIIPDSKSLVQQYGVSSAPIITTMPSGIRYEIIYQGYGTTRPTDVGSYDITIYVNDENYTFTQKNAVYTIKAKQITVTDIQVKDFVYNGTNTVEISGSLSGILHGDEVYLTLTGATADGSSAIGKHLVSITSYKLSGLKAQNYILEAPTCNATVTIQSNVVNSDSSESYIMSQSGFAEGTEVSFYTVDTQENKTSILTKLMGVSSVVVGYTIEQNGEAVINSDKYKICIEIPEEYRGKDFTVQNAGALENQTISFTREGNYITFYASTSSGQVVFSYAEFKYTFIVIASAVAFFVIGLILILVLTPLTSRGAYGNNGAKRSAIGRIKKGL